MKKLLIGSIVMLLICAFCSVAFSASARQEIAESSMINQALRSGKLKVGLSTFRPWAMYDKSNKLIGFEVDVATKVAADLGLKLELVPTDWGGIIPSLLAGKFDIIIGGMSVSAERNLKVNFSIPYDYSGMDILASKKLANGFSTVSDFNKPEVTIALRTGATSVAAVQKFMPKAKLRFFDDEAQAVQEVLVGRAHAMVSSTPLPAFEALKHKDTLFTPLSKPFTKEAIGFAVRKGDPDSLNVLDNWIRLNMDSGWLEERHNYWFKNNDWEKELK